MEFLFKEIFDVLITMFGHKKKKKNFIHYQNAYVFIRNLFADLPEDGVLICGVDTFVAGVWGTVPLDVTEGVVPRVVVTPNKNQYKSVISI